MRPSVRSRCRSGTCRWRAGYSGWPSYQAVRQILKAWSAGGVPGADAVMLDVAFSLHEATAAARELAAEKSA
jgi:hypothetical protein